MGVKEHQEAGKGTQRERWEGGVGRWGGGEGEEREKKIKSEICKIFKICIYNKRFVSFGMSFRVLMWKRLNPLKGKAD